MICTRHRGRRHQMWNSKDRILIHLWLENLCGPGLIILVNLLPIWKKHLLLAVPILVFLIYAGLRKTGFISIKRDGDQTFRWRIFFLIGIGPIGLGR